jgi:hypothetical protein
MTTGPRGVVEDVKQNVKQGVNVKQNVKQGVKQNVNVNQDVKKNIKCSYFYTLTCIFQYIFLYFSYNHYFYMI